MTVVAVRVTIQLEHLGRRFKVVFHGGVFYRLMERVICHPGDSARVLR